VVWESKDILLALEERFPHAAPLLPTDEEEKQKVRSRHNMLCCYSTIAACMQCEAYAWLYSAPPFHTATVQQQRRQRVHMYTACTQSDACACQCCYSAFSTMISSVPVCPECCACLTLPMNTCCQALTSRCEYSICCIVFVKCVPTAPCDDVFCRRWSSWLSWRQQASTRPATPS
jgi:hypothetical protein